VIDEKIALPPNLSRFSDGMKQTVELPATFDALKAFLTSINH